MEPPTGPDPYLVHLDTPPDGPVNVRLRADVLDSARFLEDLSRDLLAMYRESRRGYHEQQGLHALYTGFMFPDSSFIAELEKLGFCYNNGITNLMPIVMYSGDE